MPKDHASQVITRVIPEALFALLPLGSGWPVVAGRYGLKWVFDPVATIPAPSGVQWYYDQW